MRWSTSRWSREAPGPTPWPCPGWARASSKGWPSRTPAGFEAWLLSEQRHVAAATEAILHEAALATMSQGDLRAATDHAVRLVGLNPLDENHQALLIRLYRMAGDGEAAVRQQAACRKLFLDELGVPPGPAITEALREPIETAEPVADEASISAVLEAGAAAVSAGAVKAGVQSLRTAVAMADGADAGRLRITSRLALGEALVHSLRGQDEEGTAILHMATEVAAAIDEPRPGGRGPGRAGLRRLPPGPLRPGGSLLHRRHRRSRQRPDPAGQGHRVPRVRRQRPGRLPPRPRPPRGRGGHGQGGERRAPRGLRS